jgi:hypothetical protein
MTQQQQQRATLPVVTPPLPLPFQQPQRGMTHLRDAFQSQRLYSIQHVRIVRVRTWRHSRETRHRWEDREGGRGAGVLTASLPRNPPTRCNALFFINVAWVHHYPMACVNLYAICPLEEEPCARHDGDSQTPPHKAHTTPVSPLPKPKPPRKGQRQMPAKHTLLKQANLSNLLASTFSQMTVTNPIL